MQKFKNCPLIMRLHIVLGSITLLFFLFAPSSPLLAQSANTLYYGVHLPNVPYLFSPVLDFESKTKKNVSLVMWYQSWGSIDGTQHFQTQWMDTVRNHGSIPVITWEPWDYTKGTNQPLYSLANIINGTHDAYITRWAQDSKAWGKPYFLRFAHEMNIAKYPWNEPLNGNKPGEYVLAWKHVHDIFTQEGVTNVTWVWSPNREFQGSSPLGSLYPGDSYVNWVGMDGYNGGSSLAWGGWLTFSQIFDSTYKSLTTLAPSKPLMIAETGSAELGGSKATWITDMLGTQLPFTYPKIKAIVWFNVDNRLNGEVDWRIESTLASQTAFANAISKSYYMANNYSSLLNSPIPGPEGVTTVITPTATPTATPILTLTPTPTIKPTLTPTSSPSRITPTPTRVQDFTPPSVTITSPFDNSTITTRNITISATVTDNIKVGKVEFYGDTKLLSTDTSKPYSYRWDTKQLTKGVHTIKVVGYDTSGNTSYYQISVTK